MMNRQSRLATSAHRELFPSIVRPASSPHQARMKELEGLREIAPPMVLAFHGVFQFQPSSKILSELLILGRLSRSGVDLFFVLSGFSSGAYCST